MKRLRKIEILYIILGSMLVSFAVCTIHSKCQLTEGGQIGIELLLLHWFKISPTISSVIIDLILYLLGFLILNKKFRVNAVIGTLTYSISYFIFDKTNISCFFIDNLLISSVVGGILVGCGSGLVVRFIGSCGGDDSLALIINKLSKLPLFWCYFSMDILVIIISLSYIDVKVIPYSVLTSFLSSLFIELMSKKSAE